MTCLCLNCADNVEMSWTYIAKRAIKRVKSATFGPIFLCTLRACNSENTQVEIFLASLEEENPQYSMFKCPTCPKNIWSKLRKNLKCVYDVHAVQTGVKMKEMSPLRSAAWICNILQGSTLLPISDLVPQIQIKERKKEVFTFFTFSSCMSYFNIFPWESANTQTSL